MVSGYPTVFLPCTEVTVSNALTLNASTLAAIVSSSFSPATTQLAVLLWWATPSTAVATCSALTSANNLPINGTLNSNGTFITLDAFYPGTAPGAAVGAAACSSWPCSVNAPFGNAFAVVHEVAAAPRIQFLPQGCTGAGCVAPFFGSPFTGCANGVVSAPVATQACRPAAPAPRPVPEHCFPSTPGALLSRMNE